jgi:D-alanyl-D-alanine carboxypeptidase/D-alanyl-D-alanine-endopeptidase (penicillin-binding protein 4)
MVSDNDAAEIIARQAAIAADRPGSIKEASRTVAETLADLGAWDDVSHSYDGSGMARETTVTAEVLAEVVRLAVSGDEPSLGPLLTGLPVAGVEGSLRYRFDTAGTRGGRGLVRAKTGTLREVRSLAGYSYTADGELLIFAFVVNAVPNDYTALTWLDRVVAAVATCGCSG